MWRNWAGDTDWNLSLFGLLLALSMVGDVLALSTLVQLAARSRAASWRSSTAIVFLGSTPAAMIGVVTILAGWLRFRYPREVPADQPGHLRLVPAALGDGLLRRRCTRPQTTQADDLFYLLVFGLIVVANLIDFLLIAGYSCYVEGGSLLRRRCAAGWSRCSPPSSPRRAAGGRDRVPVHRVGLATVALFAIRPGHASST